MPQGADIVAVQPKDRLWMAQLQSFHRHFVAEHPAAFLVDDLWAAIFYFATGMPGQAGVAGVAEVVS